MAAEAGHFANQIYISQDGALHINGGAVYDDNEIDISDQLANLGSGTETFTTVTTTTLRGNASGGLTLNAAATGNGTIGLGASSDTAYLGSASGASASAALGLGAPNNSTLGVAASGGDVSIGAGTLYTGGLGSTSYSLTDLVYMLKVKGVIKA